MRRGREWGVHGRDKVDSLNNLLVTNVREVDEGVVPVKAVDPVRKAKWRGGYCSEAENLGKVFKYANPSELVSIQRAKKKTTKFNTTCALYTRCVSRQGYRKEQVVCPHQQALQSAHDFILVQTTDGSFASSYRETAELFKIRFLEVYRRAIRGRSPSVKLQT